MPLFFCHLHHPNGVQPDLIGGEYESLEAAYLDTLHAVRDVIADYAHEGKDTDGFRYEIVDEDGRTVTAVPFDERRQ